MISVGSREHFQVGAEDNGATFRMVNAVSRAG